jgi:type I restriction-modification system DNA methylase subunit
MSEELLQRGLDKKPEKIGQWDFYNIGSTTVKALKEYGIIRSVDYGDLEKKKMDALLVQGKDVIAVIEYKKPSEFKTAEQKKKAIKQELGVARKLNARIFIATDTKETVWVNVATGNRIKDEGNKELKINFEPKDEKLPSLIEKIIISINERNDQIKPKKLVNPTDLAKQIWQDIWSVSGAKPEDCLYTFVELFIFKYLSDLRVLHGMHSFYHLIDNFNTNTPDELLETYANAIRPKIKDLFPENSIDKTTIINGTIFVSKDQKAVKGYSAVFKKILGKFNDYGKLENIDYDFKSQLFESFLKESISKKNWGQFFTPLKVVRAIVEMAKDEIKEGINICDPACGVGKFLLEPLITRLEDLYNISKKGVIPKITIHGFDKGFDKDEQRTIILAKANMLIYFSDLIKENVGLTKEFSKLFNESFTLKTNSILGTLSEPKINEYDLILTNPPYVTSGSSNLKEEIKKDGDLVNHFKINAMGVEGLFMEWIIRALKPGGKAFIVVPDGIFNRQNDKNLRQFIINECIIDGIISLPLNTFFTTSKKTYILCLTRKINKKETQETPVFTYLVSEIGESRDVYRFSIEQDDLSEAVTLYSFFKGNKTSFEKINSEKRCKVIPFSKFSATIEQSWIIDKWWSEEEKIKLGIVEKDKSVKFEDLPNIIEEVANNILSFKEEILQLNEKKKSKFTLKQFTIKELFKIERGSGKYIKRYITANKGNFAVYSGNTFGAFAHINTFDYDKPCISWAIDGLAGYMMVHNEKFSATNHRGILIPLNDKINLEYVKFVLEPLFRQAKKGRIGNDGKSNEYTALPPFMIENLDFFLPIDNKGNVDVDEQKELVEKILSVSGLNKKISEYKKQIDELNVEIEDEHRNKKFKLIDLFYIDRGKSKYTKKYGNTNKGKFPIYSASNNAPLTFIDTFDYDGKFLTWATNGFAGYIMLIDGKFSINADRGLLKPKFENINIQYVKSIIEPKFRELAKGRKGEKGEDEFTKVYPSMIENVEIEMFVDEKGNFDIEKQNYIAEKYQKIEQIKKNLLEELDKIIGIEINLE